MTSPSFPINYSAFDYDSLLDFMDSTAQILLPEWTSRNVLDINYVTMQIIAGMLEISNFYSNYAVNESVPTSVRTAEGFYRLARSRGFYPTSYQSGEMVATVTRATTVDPVTIIEGDSATTSAGVTFVVMADVTYGVGEASKSVSFIYGTFQSATFTSTFTANQYEIFNVPFSTIVTNTIKVYVDEGVGEEQYEILESLNLAGSTDKSVMLIIQDDGSTSVQFGDGVNGYIPALNSTIRYTCVLSPSTRVADNYGNIGANLITSITGFTHDTITHPASSGGFRYLALKDLIRDLALFEASSARAVTDRDHEYLARRVNGVGIAKAKTGGFATTLIYCADSTGVPISVEKQLEVESYVQRRAVDGKNVEVRSATQVSIDIIISIIALENQTNSQVQSLADTSIDNLFIALASSYATSLYEGHLYKHLMDGIETRVKKISITRLARSGEVGVNDIDLATTEVISQGTITISVTGGLS
jgi:hypothetical protein